MTTKLERGVELPLNLCAGMIIGFKSSRFDLTTTGGALKGGAQATLDLYNNQKDIILRIKICRGKNKVFFNDFARKSLVDGWGQEQSVDLNPTDIQKWQRSGVTISVHDCSTHSEQRYQILFDLTTVYYFDKQFPGPAIKAIYREAPEDTSRPHLSNPLKVVVYLLTDLSPKEGQAIVSGRAPSAIRVPDSGTISIRPSHFVSNQTYASISWDHGKEIRIYYLGFGNVLQEYAYSASRERNIWYYGSLSSLNIIIDPGSTIAAIQLEDGINCVYYQEPNTDLIRSLYQLDHTQPWNKGRSIIGRAVKGSSFAVIRPPIDDRLVSCVYYQDPQLHLRSRYRYHYSDLNTSDHSEWTLGAFKTGVQPRGTPITAEVVHGGDVDINVTWRDARGRVVTGSWSKSSGWDLPNDRSLPLDGRD